MVVGNATVRSRGSGTRNPQKPGLRIDFNRYNTSQRFLGLKYIVLDNAWQDASMLRERVTMLLLDRMGMPAPRERMRLFINGAYAGLYMAVEALDDIFVERSSDPATGTCTIQLGAGVSLRVSRTGPRGVPHVRSQDPREGSGRAHLGTARGNDPDRERSA